VSDAEAKRDPLIGQTIRGRFRVLRKLGEGGMGVVYLADQVNFHRKVALKVLHGYYTRDEEFIERFQREARLAAMLNHPHIVTVYDFDRGEDGSLFIAMEYVEGRDLRDIIQEGGMGVREAVRFARQIAEGLERAHGAGVIHRDIKPENVMISSTTNEVKLMDFGIASMKDAEGMTRLTRTGTIVGTPAYMAPERMERGQTDEKTDIYSFGVLLYEMLTGDVPFSAPTPASMLLKQLREIPRSVRTLRAEIPASLEGVVMQALAREPQKRQVSIGTIAQALRKIESSLASEKPGPGTFGGLGISGRAVAIMATLVLGTGTTAWIITAPHHVQKLLAEGLALVGLEKGDVGSTPATETETGQRPVAPRGPNSATSVQNSGEAGKVKPPEEPVVKEHLAVGGFYLDRGQYSEAIAEFEQALSLDPRNQEVREHLERAKRAWNAERKLGLAR
jgi:eukaryotic-like serine/threonine-protein kinase